VRLEQAKIVIPQLFEPKLSEYEGWSAIVGDGELPRREGVRAKEQKLTSATD